MLRLSFSSTRGFILSTLILFNFLLGIADPGESSCIYEWCSTTTHSLSTSEGASNEVVCQDGAPIVAISHFLILDLSQWTYKCAIRNDKYNFSITNTSLQPWQNQVTYIVNCSIDRFIAGVLHSNNQSQILCNKLEGSWLSDCWWENDSVFNHRNSSIVADVGVVLRTVFKQTFPGARYSSWSYELCRLNVAKCEVPVIPHGTTSADTQSTVLTGSIFTGVYRSPSESINITCNQQHYLVGNDTVQCLPRGSWSQLPTCERCRKIKYCTAVSCTSRKNTICLQCMDKSSDQPLSLILSPRQKKCISVPVVTIAPPVWDGSSVTLTCSVQGRPSPKQKWIYNGTEISDDDNYEIQRGGILVILNLTSDTSGFYYCTASNSAGADTDYISVNSAEYPNEVTMTGYYPPVIYPVQSGTGFDWFQGNLGSQLAMTCRCSGYPLPSITWWRRVVSRYQKVHYGERVVTHFNGTLEFDPLLKQDHGIYICRARNSLGRDDRCFILLVRVPASPYYAGSIETGIIGISNTTLIVNWVVNYTVPLGHQLELPCNVQVQSENRVDVTWLRDLQEVNNSRNGTIYFHSITFQDAGVYICCARVAGSMDIDIRQTLVTVTELSTPPVEVQIEPEPGSVSMPSSTSVSLTVLDSITRATTTLFTPTATMQSSTSVSHTVPLARATTILLTPNATMPSSTSVSHTVPLARATTILLTPTATMPSSTSVSHTVPLARATTTLLTPNATMPSSTSVSHTVPFARATTTLLTPNATQVYRTSSGRSCETNHLLLVLFCFVTCFVLL